MRPQAARLVLASASALFLELLLVRWLGGEAPLLAYFKNFPLLAAFLGMGVGARLAGRRDLGPLAPLALGALGLALAASESLGLGLYVLGQPDPDLDVWQKTGHPEDALRSLVLGVLLLGAIAAGFVALGQSVGRLLDEAGPRLAAYGLDLAGSLAGVLGALAAAASGLPPARLFSVGLVAFALSAPRSLPTIALATVFAVAVPVADAASNRGRVVVWSPYQRIDVSPHVVQGVRLGERLSVNRDLHQVLVDLSDASLAAHPRLVRPRRRHYALPWLATGVPAGGARVLVAGAGAGNDVAEALRRGAAHVTAVELDPAIAELGRARHPENPYGDERTTLVADDARAAFRGLRGAGFDVLVYGLLDAHASLAAFGSLRHEEYVYTVEGIRAGLATLSPGGVAALTFYEGDRPWLGDRLAATIREAEGEPPVVARVPGEGSVYVLFGPGLDRDGTRERLASSGLEDEAAARLARGARPTTDDWPFLYVRGVPRVYLGALAGLVLATLAATWLAGGRSPSGGDARSLEMALLGAAFLLLETKGIADLARFFGATWLVTGLVLAAVLAVLVLANAVAARVPERLGPAAGVLAALALLAQPVAAPLVEALAFAPRALGAALLVGVPVGLGGVAFSRAFARVPAGQAGRALGANLAGAALGGGLEALSLVAGLRALGLLAAGLYVAWALLHFRSRLRERTRAAP